jgi:hypothetical protein
LLLEPESFDIGFGEIGPIPILPLALDTGLLRNEDNFIEDVSPKLFKVGAPGALAAFCIVLLRGVSGVKVVCGAGGSAGALPRLCIPATTDAADTGAVAGVANKFRLCGATAMPANICDPLCFAIGKPPYNPSAEGGLIPPVETARAIPGCGVDDIAFANTELVVMVALLPICIGAGTNPVDDGLGGSS